MNSERRHLSPQEKVAALKRHLLENVPVSTLCDQLGIAPTLFYRWQKELFENGHVVFELTRKNEVMAELMEALTEEKKRNGEL
jgi:transposase-like protein